MTSAVPASRAGWSAALLASSLLGGCATRDGAGHEAKNPDPFEPVNRVIYQVNDFGDHYLAKPVAKAYEKGTPRAFRVGANNFFENLRYPITIVNDLLQGKVRQGGADFARFVVNTTVGLGGLFDPAAEMGLKLHDEDFGQTLSVWGVPQGPYLMVPVFGPYTVSSGVGDLLGTQVSPLVQAPDDRGTANALWLWYLVHYRYSVLGADEEIQRAYDPYAFIRDAYLQNRLYKIYDGNVPEDQLYPEEDLEDDEAP